MYRSGIQAFDRSRKRSIRVFGGVHKKPSLQGEYDPMTIELDACIELIQAKRKSDAEKHIHTFDDEAPAIQVLHGRWGPYIKMEKKNYKIPKDVEAEGLDRAQCIHIIENQPKKTRGRAKAKPKSKSKKK